MKLSNQSGYIALIGVILIGSAILLALIALSLGISTGTKIVNEKTLSFKSSSLATACAEEALGNLWQDSQYLGNEIIEFEDGLCGILPISTTTGDFIIQTYGNASETMYRLEVIASSLSPYISISSWRSLTSF
jgi:hypothetical protein